jgi:hypothetical protein
LTPELKSPGAFFRHFFALAGQVPILAHLAGLGQPLQGLKGAAFLPADFAGALAIIIFPYIMGISSWGLAKLRGFCSYLFGLSYKLFARSFASAFRTRCCSILSRAKTFNCRLR